MSKVLAYACMRTLNTIRLKPFNVGAAIHVRALCVTVLGRTYQGILMRLGILTVASCDEAREEKLVSGFAFGGRWPNFNWLAFHLNRGCVFDCFLSRHGCPDWTQSSQPRPLQLGAFAAVHCLEPPNAGYVLIR